MAFEKFKSTIKVLKAELRQSIDEIRESPTPNELRFQANSFWNSLKTVKSKTSSHISDTIENYKFAVTDNVPFKIKQKPSQICIATRVSFEKVIRKIHESSLLIKGSTLVALSVMSMIPASNIASDVRIAYAADRLNDKIAWEQANPKTIPTTVSLLPSESDVKTFKI